MNLDELESFKISDAVNFHDQLNPALWTKNNELDPEVKKQLMIIAKDFLADIGVSSYKVEDITISGSNAAYSYTPHSDLDLHILVDYKKLPDTDVYKELFNAKKTVYNDKHNIKVHGVTVELYVQDSNQPHASVGEYSLLKNEWNKFPVKRRANFDQAATKLKYEKLGELIEVALKSKNLEDVNRVLDIIKRYRKAGLEKTGEFGPENLAFKAIRKQGLIQKLFDLKQRLRSKKLSIEDYDPNGPPPGPEFKPTMPQGTVRVDVSDVYDWYKLGQNISNLGRADKSQFGKGPPSTIMAFGDEDIEHKYIQALQKLGLDTTDIDPIDKNQPTGMRRQKVDPTYNVNEILDKQSASYMTWDEGESNELYNEIRATAKDKKNNTLKYNFYEFPKYDLTAIEFSRAVGPWGDNYSIDKSGDQYTVFATLLQAIKNYLSAGKPEYIFFAAKEPSRAKLYQTFVNRFANQFGYKQISADNIPRAVSATLYSSNDTPFLLQKVDKKKQGVAETFDQPYNIIWSKGDHGDWDAYTTLDDDTRLEIAFLDQGENSWMVDFFRDDSTEITGAGDAYRVFATVLTAMRQFIKKKKPARLNFVAEKHYDPKGNRAKLYDRMIQRYIGGTGYNLSKENMPGGATYSLTRAMQGVTEGTDTDYMAGHCHVMALALKQLHPDWKIRAHIGWDEESEDDEEYRIDHVYIVSPDGSAYDCRGKFSNEEELLGPDETGGVDTQFVDYSFADLKADVARGELKRFTKQDVAKAVGYIQRQGVAEGTFNKCFDKACKLYDKAVEKNLDPILYQVADYRGDGSNADGRWAKLPQHVWSHYVTVIGDTVFDPTAKQFGPDKSEKYNIKQLETEWGKIYKIRPREQTVAEASGYIPSEKDFFFDYGFDPKIKELILSNMFSNPSFSCQNEVFRWAKKLQKAGLDVEIQHGFYLPNFEQDDAEGHTWLEVEGSIFDPTAGQFDDNGQGEYQVHEIETLNEASGYIPSKREKNDPRFKTALTVDVKPNSIKKNAKAFGFNISRSGIPPTAKTNGRIK